MVEADKDWMMIRVVGGWMFLLVLAHLCSPGERAIKRLLLHVACKPSVLWRCWLGSRKGIRPVKTGW